MTCIKTPDGWVNRSDEPCTTDQHGNPTRHCKRNNRCGRHLEPHDEMCPVCVGKIRTNLLAVEELAALMEAEAMVAGVNSEAANLAGPWTNAVRWDWARGNAVRAAWAKGADVEPVRADFAVDLLHQPEDDIPEIEAIVDKNRHGPRGVGRLEVWGHYARLQGIGPQEAVSA